MNITLPLRYDDGELLDLDFDDQDKVIEKNDKLTNVAHADALRTNQKTFDHPHTQRCPN